MSRYGVPKGRPAPEIPLFEEDADQVGRACAAGMQLADRQRWKDALEVVRDAVSRVESPGHLTPSGLPGSQEHALYLHFSGPFPMEAYRRFLLPAGTCLHAVLDDFPLLYLIKGRCLRHLDRSEEAMAAYTAALAWNPMSPEAALGLTAAAREAGARERVEPALVAGLTCSLTLTDAARFYGELALVADSKGDAQMAAALSSVGLALDPLCSVAYDESVYLEYRAPEAHRQAQDLSQAVALVSKAGLLLAPNRRYLQLAYQLANEAEKNGSVGRAAYFLQSAQQLAPSSATANRVDKLATQAAQLGQRTDGFDGFLGSGTFISPVGAPQAGSAPDADPLAVLLAGAHDHRAPGSPMGTGQRPNALGGMPGVSFPGQSEPYQGQGRTWLGRQGRQRP